ncbi:MAG: zinc-ribbon domain-containing protein, partial [Clostridiaceae bacterium]|nr:zinc-ribbon domain-containing protein [Clostridiaceae bacterium]
MNCPICGYQAKENDRFCRSCGAVLENRVQSQTT